MKIIRIDILEETNNYHLINIKFKNWYGKEFVKKCYKDKSITGVYYYDSGDPIPVKLWESVNVFLEIKSKL